MSCLVGMVLLAHLPACHKVFPFPSGEPDSPDTTPTGDMAQTHDRLVINEMVVPMDATSDTGPPPVLNCSVPEMLDPASDLMLMEPAISVDGETLYAKMKTTPRTIYRIPRGADNFGQQEWVSANNEITPGKQDMTFFAYDKKSYMIAAIEPIEPPQANRYLELCVHEVSGWGNCQALDLQLAGIPWEQSFDGPSVVVDEQHGPLMMFNAEDRTSTGVDLYKLAKIFQATPVDPSNMLTWSVQPGVLLDDPETGEDDPALSDDGLILCYCKLFPEPEKGRLYCATRANTAQPFSTSQEIEFPEPISGAYAPELFYLSEFELEIFFTSTTDFKIYRIACTVE